MASSRGSTKKPFAAPPLPLEFPPSRRCRLRVPCARESPHCNAGRRRCTRCNICTRNGWRRGSNFAWPLDHFVFTLSQRKFPPPLAWLKSVSSTCKVTFASTPATISPAARLPGAELGSRSAMAFVVVTEIGGVGLGGSPRTFLGPSTHVVLSSETRPTYSQP